MTHPAHRHLAEMGMCWVCHLIAQKKLRDGDELGVSFDSWVCGLSAVTP